MFNRSPAGSAKSDDSPLKKKYMSPTKRGRMAMEESDLLDLRIRDQIDYIRQVRRETKEAIFHSGAVVESFNQAQESYRERIESKKYEHLGNENFVRSLLANPNYRQINGQKS